MNRRTFLRSLGAGAAALAAPRLLSAQDTKKPNILFLFADDQCFQTIHALGNDEIQTPNLDRLAARSVTFTHAYNQGSWSGAVCVASRTMLNTGLFLWNAQRIYGKTDQEFRQKNRMWGQLLAGGGYDTYMTGKWHVKAKAEGTFKTVRNVRAGMPKQSKQGYNRPIDGKPDPWSPYDKKFGGFWQGGTHWSEVLGNDAVDFLGQAAKADDPFFMYLAFNAPHDPRQSPKEYVDRYPADKVKLPENFLPEYPYKDAIGCGKGLRDEKLAPFPRTPHAVKVNRQEYYAIITHMDAQIGRILEALEKSGKADNTYIFFTADHGLAVGQHGLMGKQNLYDHSVRVPLMVSGPGVPKDKKLDMPVYLQDLMPTSLELAGVPKPKHVQFKSLMPLIRGESKSSYDAIYGGYLSVQRMVTDDGHKLLLYPRIKRARLYNLKADPLEKADLAARPESVPVMKKLFATFLALQKETGDPMDMKKVFPELL
ncbi:sulfatase-like hydrolase/transferase [bacterium]|nr:sulfatase-like hydrolase/transferase [bacterium]